MLKGETLVDTAHEHRGDGAGHDRAAPRLVGRLPPAGAASASSRIINAGDGMHEHPTQALLDAFTIREHKKRIEGLKVAIVGDLLHSRVLRSNVLLLTKLGADVWVSGPPTLMPARHRAVRRARHDVGRRGGRRRRRDHDAADPAGADAGRVLPVAARVLQHVRHDRRARRAREARRDHHASRTDEPRRRDRVGRRRRSVLGDPRAGRQRRRGADGGAVSARGRAV